MTRLLENHIIMRSSCDRTIANRIAKEIMDLYNRKERNEWLDF